MSDSTRSQPTTTTPTASTPTASGPAASGTSAGQVASATGTAAKQHAGAVAQTATGDAKEVAGTAVEQAKQVAQESGDQARHLLDEARTQGQQQAAQQKQRAADGLRSVAQELQTMAGHSGQQGVATTAARQAGQRLDAAARWLEQREPQELVEEVRSYARRKPGAFLAGAALAGVLAGRLFRGAKDASSNGTTAAGNPDDPRLPVPSDSTSGFGAPGVSPGAVGPGATGATGGIGDTGELPLTEPGTDDLVVDLTDERSAAAPPFRDAGMGQATARDEFVEPAVGERPLGGTRGTGGAPL